MVDIKTNLHPIVLLGEEEIYRHPEKLELSAETEEAKFRTRSGDAKSLMNTVLNINKTRVSDRFIELEILNVHKTYRGHDTQRCVAKSAVIGNVELVKIGFGEPGRQ